MTPHIYIIAASNGMLKIGVSNHPQGRVLALETGLPFDLRVVRSWPHPDAYQVEKRAHRALAEHRVKREWFNVTIDQATAAIEGALASSNVTKIRPEPPAPVIPADDWVFANTAWNIEKGKRIHALRETGREMNRHEQRAWLAEGGMDDCPPPPIPWAPSR